ncbi:hypothetical protein Pa4123_17270 [Phytohabitans aurantiacus]|uniref:CBM6 domain-containing protein n=1 Tax=Phytohabitans aurantiacus TaxID=3016789 RepID=A0ABQ5QPT8_9ACTN|nr:hypothetical protein Pa4123_17270 [Phytohabitans aurantiacus]
MVALTASALMFLASPASAATLTEVTNFGTNPSNLRMHLYVPDNVQARPGLLVALHWCTGTGPVFHRDTQFAQLADRHGFIVIYPTANRSSQCFDVYTQQALTRGGGSDPVGIRSMVGYVQSRYNVDPNRIFAAGMSSGAMMTNVLLALYPDVFRAGAAFAGVPYTCFRTTGGSEWSTECANGQIIRTPQQWGDAVRNAYPGYTGPRPRMQLWHGTNDDALRYPNFTEEIKQWTNVHGLNQTPVFTDSPGSGQTRTRYGGTGGQAPVEAISMQGVGHNLPINATEAIRFFGLNAAPPTSPPPSSPPPGGSTTRYEAEASPAVCTGTIDSNWSGYSGSGFCNGGNAAGAYAQFAVNAPAAGTATLRVRFANGVTTARPASLIVNGATVQTPSFEGTGAWSTWMTKTLTVTLNAGGNTIRLNPTTANGLPNIDYLEITTSS